MADSTPLNGWPHVASPFHEGELRIQGRLGFRDRIDAMARRSVRDYMPEQHRTFFEQLPFLLLGTVDDKRRPWASLVAGKTGFIKSPDPHHLNITAKTLPSSPLQAHIKNGIAVGVLGLEPHTRRRNRMNGTISRCTDIGFNINVVQSFGNCPRYIHTRTMGFTGDETQALPAIHRDGLDNHMRAIIAAADTFYIATAFENDDNPLANGVDVSHRGGKPGFTKVEGNLLTFPDFNGNRIFNTLGNIEMNPKAGLLFINYDTRDMVYLTGAAKIIWGGAELEGFAGAERLVTIDVEEAIFVKNSFPLRSAFLERSPFTETTGSWGQ
ncbi:MAG: pyridoxamine 5'-phosphate oxidase family protein [Parvibaculum sp.]